MTQNKIKSFGLNIDEEKDPFLTFLNKKVRNNRKKLDQIEELSKRDKTTLKAEQIEKINSKNEVKENMKYIDNIRLMYYEALKVAKDEGKLPPQQTGEVTDTIQTQEPAQVETKQEQIAQPVIDHAQLQREREEEIARTTRQNLTRIINLVHFAQFFRDQSKVQEFRNENVADVDIVYDLYAKIFTFSESDKFVKIDDKIKGSVHELESYINAVDQPALRNKSYRSLQNTVEALVHTPAFRNHKADVETVQSKAPVETSGIGSIGSELKKGYDQPQKLGVPAEDERLVPHVGSTQQQDKHRSPEKEVKTEHVAQPERQEERSKQDWGNLEDEEEEEEEQEEEEYEGEGEGEGEVQQGEEEQKQEKTGDDEWATVKPRYAQKKEEPVNRGGRGGYRGRGRGGYRKPRPEGEEQRGEGQQREYRPRRRPEGEGKEETKEGQEGQTGENKPRGEYRGGRGGYRGQGRGGYRGGNREGGEGQSRGEYRPRGGQGRGGFNRGPRNDQGQTQQKPQEGERKETPAA